MAAYGLYTHIQANRRRSVALLIGLFFLVYVLIYAGALVAEAMTYGDAPLELLVQQAAYDFIKAAPFATIGTIVWVLIAYKFHQKMIDMVTGAHDVTRQEEPQLYNLLENLCISRGIPMPKLQDRRGRRAQRLRHRPQREAIFDHGDARSHEHAQRRRRSKRCSATSSPTSATATCACW